MKNNYLKIFKMKMKNQMKLIKNNLKQTYKKIEQCHYKNNFQSKMTKKNCKIFQ